MQYKSIFTYLIKILPTFKKRVLHNTALALVEASLRRLENILGKNTKFAPWLLIQFQTSSMCCQIKVRDALQKFFSDEIDQCFV